MPPKSDFYYNEILRKLKEINLNKSFFMDYDFEHG